MQDAIWPELGPSTKRDVELNGDSSLTLFDHTPVLLVFAQCQDPSPTMNMTSPSLSREIFYYYKEGSTLMLLIGSYFLKRVLKIPISCHAEIKDEKISKGWVHTGFSYNRPHGSIMFDRRRRESSRLV